MHETDEELLKMLFSPSFPESSVKNSILKTDRKSQWDLLVYIGRFQPLHLGHVKVIDTALSISKKVLVLLGSSFSSRTIKNPFTEGERAFMIDEYFFNNKNKLFVRPIVDYPYNNNRWIQQVQEKVLQVVGDAKDLKIGLIGHEKDDTSWYLRAFPQWEFIGVESYHNPAKNWNVKLNSTDIREAMFENNWFAINKCTPENVRNFFNNFKRTDEFSALKAENDFIKKYRKQWEVAPYPVQFTTVDAVVVCQGHILLIKRRANPGKGLWALPGGFKNVNETSRQAVMRELMEETKIFGISDVMHDVVGNKIRDQNPIVFDDPARSLRGTTITHAFFVEIFGGMPNVVGADDAEQAKWVSFQEFAIMRQQMFEDHYHIIDHFIGIKEQLPPFEIYKEKIAKEFPDIDPFYQK